MKLASLKDGRDGRLVVVDRRLQKCVAANGIADTLQHALDEWDNLLPRLRELAEALESGRRRDAQPFNPRLCAAPLARAFQIADGSAYLSHVELVRRARGSDMPPEFKTEPLMYQAVSDSIMGPMDPIIAADEAYGIDFEAEVAVITGDVPMGSSAEEAAEHIRLIMIMNDVSLRNLIPAELAKGFGFFHGKPPNAFSPVAVTPEELGSAWKDGKIHLPIISTYNGREIGRPDAGADMQFSFPQLIAHAAKTRPLGAGTIIGSGTVSNYDRSRGVSCLAEIRMIEKIEQGESKTSFMKFGDTIRIEMKDGAGQSVFGAIEQKVLAA